MKRILAMWFLASTMFCAPTISHAVIVTVPSANPGQFDAGTNPTGWHGYMTVRELPSNGGGYVFESGWGVSDLNTSWSGSVLTLSPNTIGDPDPFWYQGGGGPGAPGNKNMFASYYNEVTGPLSGTTVTFKGEVLSNSFTSAHNTVAFIKDFAADYSSVVTQNFPLTSPGVFSFSLNTIPMPGRHVQFGFETTGVNVWATDVAPFGSIQITAVPEPSSLLLGLTALAGAFLRGRRR
jgi:hypothetical protein